MVNSQESAEAYGGDPTVRDVGTRSGEAAVAASASTESGDDAHVAAFDAQVNFVKNHGVDPVKTAAFAEAALQAPERNGSGSALDERAQGCLLELVEAGRERATNCGQQGIYIIVSRDAEDNIPPHGIRVGVSARKSGVQARLKEHERAGASTPHGAVRLASKRTDAGLLLHVDLARVLPSQLLRSFVLEGLEAMVTSIIVSLQESSICAGMFGSPATAQGLDNTFAGRKAKRMVRLFLCRCLLVSRGFVYSGAI